MKINKVGHHQWLGHQSTLFFDNPEENYETNLRQWQGKQGREKVGQFGKNLGK